MAIAAGQRLEIENLVDQYGLTLCVECGKCVAVCPMELIFDDFSYEVSPRGVIEAVLVDGDTDLFHKDHFWFCLTCNECTDICPAGVQFRDFVDAARQLAMQSGVTERVSFCSNCGAYLQPKRLMQYMNDVLGEAADEFLDLCPRCRQYDFATRVRSSGLRVRSLPSPRKESGASQ